MNRRSPVLYLGAAVVLHAAVLYGWRFSQPAFIADEGEQGESMEVGLVEMADEVAEPEPTPPEPPTPELPPEPPPAEVVPPPEPPPPTPPPDAIVEPTPAPEPPKPATPPAPRPKPQVPTRPPSDSVAKPGVTGTPTGTPNAGVGKPGPGDNSHATWRNRVKPGYPSAARTARQAGQVLIIVNVNALGQCTGARISQSSGFPSLDQAALSAARASSYNPKRIAGIPLPDTITVPYSFRLDAR